MGKQRFSHSVLDRRIYKFPDMTEKLRENLLSDVEVRAMISSRAHELYRLRAQEHGRDLEDWFQAENEILALASLVENQIQYVLSLPDQKSETNLFDIFLRLCRDLTNHARSGPATYTADYGPGSPTPSTETPSQPFGEAWSGERKSLLSFVPCNNPGHTQAFADALGHMLPNYWGGWWSWSGGYWRSRGGGGMQQNVVQNAGVASEATEGTLSVGQISVSATVNVSFLIE
ncbi:MAG: hypothetical protein DMG06_30070 [Acidobacteria bacterium]|nr:MAG: hypothetical protein DMG06_30070 [Acidobacteriota bacterium]